jgi:hypothetical protein
MNSNEQPDLAQEVTKLPGNPLSTALVLLLGGAGLMVVALGLAWGNEGGLARFMHVYLVNYAYFLSISLGAVFFVAVQHVTHAGWSVSVRRLMEILAANAMLMAVLFLPILATVLMGSGVLYVWADRDAFAADTAQAAHHESATQNDAEVHNDEHGEHAGHDAHTMAAHRELLDHKSPYLNGPFFAVRFVVYFVVWIGLARFFLKRSREQDETGDHQLTNSMERISPIAIVLFGVTVSFASFDMLMSLDPFWFSTIYGLYYFSGAVVGFFATMILVAMTLQATGRLTNAITVEHYHELGKLLFAFVVFWGYIAFSQYMLIWYANIPEETVWFKARQSTQAWVILSLVLLCGHLLLPFIGLISRGAKRSKAILAFWAIWLLIAHWIDMYYLVMPKFYIDMAHHDITPPSFGPVDVISFVALGAAYLGGLALVAGNGSLLANRDPRLNEALAFENA